MDDIRRGYTGYTGYTYHITYHTHILSIHIYTVHILRVIIHYNFTYQTYLRNA